jgi:hypothetical protein
MGEKWSIVLFNFIFKIFCRVGEKRLEGSKGNGIGREVCRLIL